MIRTAVVILNWNGLAWIQKFLGTVVKYSTNKETIVCVADNGSSDGSSKWVRDNFPDVKVLDLGKNNGFAGGYNLALSQIDARYFVLLNSDVEVTPGWLDPLVSCLDDSPDIAACQPRIKSYNKKEYFEYAGAAGGFIDMYGFTFCRGRIFGRVEKDVGQYDDAVDIFWASGACMAVRKEAWDKSGGLDNEFFAHMEEIDLCWRFHSAGLRVAYVPGSLVFHAGGGALPYESEFKIYLNFRNNLFLLYKNLPDEKLGRTIFIRKMFDGLAAFRFLLLGKIRNVGAIRKAHRDFTNAIRENRVSRRFVNQLPEVNSVLPFLNKSVVFEFYLKGRKTFKSLL